MAGHGIKSLVGGLYDKWQQNRSKARKKVRADLVRHFMAAFANLDDAEVEEVKLNGHDIFKVTAKFHGGPYYFHVVINTSTLTVSLYMGPDQPNPD